MDLESFRKEWNSPASDCLDTPMKDAAPTRKSAASSDYYFNSYSHFGIHEEMLKDSVRTGTYQNVILANKHLFEGKTVLDVGSGTGILSLFAAKAGAKKVIGVEFSEIVGVARRISEVNEYPNIIYVQGKVEEVDLPLEEGEKVDIIISEWMGYFLLYESMLDTVLFARDKWLKPDGLIFPNKAKIYLAGIEDQEYKQERTSYWDSVYGFDFSPLKRCVMEEPVVDVVDSKAVVTDSCCVLDIDLNTCSLEDLEFTQKFELTCRKKDFVHAFISWFDISFTGGHKPVTFSTGPFAKYTHWKQTVFYFEGRLVCHKGEKIEGCLGVRKNSRNPRDLDIKVSYTFEGKDQKTKGSNLYRLR